MIRWWRKALVASLILLLATSGVLFLRLDPDKLSASVRSQLQQWSGQKIQTGSASLSLLHGASLRIQNVDVVRTGKQPWHLHADSIRLGLSVWHLLQGKTRIKYTEIIHPVLDLSKPPQMKDLTMMVLPKSLKRMRMRRGNIRIGGLPVAQDFDGTVRRISKEQELTWEVQTNFFGGDLTTQGRIRHDSQGRSSIFGKLKARHLHLKDAPKTFASMTLPQPAYDTVESSLTFDVNVNREWSLFGDAMLHASLKKAPSITWRGKVEGTGMQRLNWHDAFFQIGRNAMFSTIGDCARGKGCNFSIDTRNAEIPPLLKTLNLTAPVKGTLDAKSSFSWKHGQWSAKGKLATHRISWSDISVPDTTVSVPNVLYHASGHVELAGIHLQTGDADGNMTLNSLIQSGEKWHLDAHIKNMAHAWIPFANILLKSHDIKPNLKGKGVLNANVEVSHTPRHTGIDFSIRASQAQLGYAGRFEKPKNIPADITAHADIEGNKTSFSIQHATLGNSSANQVQWVSEQEKIKSVSAENLHVDLTKLKQNGIVFPDVMKDWHGSVRGRFSHVQPSAKTNMPDWFAESGAKLELADFGVGKQQWNGLIDIRNGTLSTHSLLWENSSQHARLDGTINLASRQGNINLQDAILSWKQGDALPVWVNQAKLHGRLRNIDLDWMRNTWSGLHGAYRIRGKHITLRKVRGKLAGGSVQSPKLSLVLSPESIHFSGPVRMAIVRLNKLEGLSGALGANLDGYMYLNANLEGELPWRTKSAWQGNGDIEIQHGHWQPVNKKLVIAAEGLRAETGKAIPFSRFTTRFHLEHRVLQLTRMQLETGTKQITGNAFLHPNGEIGGRLQIRDERGTQKSGLLGNWPEATGFLGTK